LVSLLVQRTVCPRVIATAAEVKDDAAIVTVALGVAVEDAGL
jgi:hypothetical protein